MLFSTVTVCLALYGARAQATGVDLDVPSLPRLFQRAEHQVVSTKKRSTIGQTQTRRLAGEDVYDEQALPKRFAAIRRHRAKRATSSADFIPVTLNALSPANESPLDDTSTTASPSASQTATPNYSWSWQRSTQTSSGSAAHARPTHSTSSVNSIDAGYTGWSWYTVAPSSITADAPESTAVAPSSPDYNWSWVTAEPSTTSQANVDAGYSNWSWATGPVSQPSATPSASQNEANPTGMSAHPQAGYGNQVDDMWEDCLIGEPGCEEIPVSMSA